MQGEEEPRETTQEVEDGHADTEDEFSLYTSYLYVYQVLLYVAFTRII